MKSRVLAAALLLIAAFGVSGCGEQWSWNEKVTVEVETPAGTVRGSSVIRLIFSHQDSGLVPREARGARLTVYGEAVAVEIAPGRYLFALLDGLPSPFTVFFPGEAPVAVADRFETLREAREVPREHYPLLVTFGDIADPTSVRRVDPDNLAASFGPGVSLGRITLAITDEPVTEGRIEQLLGWLDWPKIDPSLNENRAETLRYPNESPRGYGTISTLSLIRR